MSEIDELTLRTLSLVVVVLVAAAISVAAGAALKVAGAQPHAVLAGGGAAFVSSVGLILMAWQVLAG